MRFRRYQRGIAGGGGNSEGAARETNSFFSGGGGDECADPKRSAPAGRDFADKYSGGIIADQDEYGPIASGGGQKV